MHEPFVFIIALLLPLFYWRILSYTATGYMQKPFLRRTTGLTVHHLHYGVLFVFIAALLLLFSGRNIFVIVFLGLGLGLILDLFIPSLIMKTDRRAELKVYRETFMGTVILFVVVISAILLFLFLLHR